MRRKATAEVIELPDLIPEDPEVPREIEKVSAEDLFATQLRQFPNLQFVRELQFARGFVKNVGSGRWRQWKFDFSFEKYRLAVEIEGLAVQIRCRKCHGRELIVRGRHGSVGGIQEDMEKYNYAAVLGWTVLRFPVKAVKPRLAIDMTIRVLARRGWKR